MIKKHIKTYTKIDNSSQKNEIKINENEQSILEFQCNYDYDFNHKYGHYNDYIRLKKFIIENKKSLNIQDIKGITTFLRLCYANKDELYSVLI